jgi:TATA-binding protein-associated factor
MAVQEEKDDNAAFRRAKKLDDDGITLRQAQVDAVRRMQAQFAGHILRRTVDSQNWKGQTLLDLPPHKDILGILQLTEREKDIINARAEDARARLAVSFHFHLHPCLCLF